MTSARVSLGSTGYRAWKQRGLGKVALAEQLLPAMTTHGGKERESWVHSGHLCPQHSEQLRSQPGSQEGWPPGAGASPLSWEDSPAPLRPRGFVSSYDILPPREHRWVRLAMSETNDQS